MVYRVYICVYTRKSVIKNICPLSEACVACIERKYNEVNIINQELALHGRVCKYGMLLFEAVSQLRVTSAKIVSISTIHEAYVEDMAASIRALEFDLHDNKVHRFFKLRVRPSYK